MATFRVKAPGGTNTVRVRVQPGLFKVFTHGEEVKEEPYFKHYPSVFIRIDEEETGPALEPVAPAVEPEAEVPAPAEEPKKKPRKKKDK